MKQPANAAPATGHDRYSRPYRLYPPLEAITRPSIDVGRGTTGFDGAIRDSGKTWKCDLVGYACPKTLVLMSTVSKNDATWYNRWWVSRDASSTGGALPTQMKS